jgi:formylglycine-generating enzyme required for sulfatase activity
MGIVYRAHQYNPDRDVAVKVLPPALGAHSALLARFNNEAEIAGRLVDAHLLPVYGVEELDGLPVIIMPCIEGSDLNKVIKHRRAVKEGKEEELEEPVHPWALLDDREYTARILPILDQVVSAVTALHRAGVLHRDIKPSNVLIDQHGNAWLSDFGLARLQGADGMTLTGHGLGSRPYASPEQAKGEKEIDYRADLFSLGATLYQALTLRLPYDKHGARESSEPPKAPSRLQRELPRDFDLVILHALEPDPGRRYQTASQMEEHWRLARKGELPWPLAGRMERLWRKARRHLAATAAAVFLLLTIVFGSLAAVFFPRDRTVYRTVKIETEPPGCQVALVPLNADTGYLVPEARIRPTEKTPLTVRKVPIGEYLVVAQRPDDGFHEVYRTVPSRGRQTTGVGNYRDWKENDDGSVTLPAITVPGPDVTRGMVHLRGGHMTAGQAPQLFEVDVAGFYMDPTEVTEGDFERIYPRHRKLLQDLGQRIPDSAEPVALVNFEMAMAYAESVGKCLPDEFQWEWAATNGGTTQFPWGDEPKRGPWQYGKVGETSFDRTLGPVPLLGLYSNVAEWTLSWNVPYPNLPPEVMKAFFEDEAMQARFRGTRIIRGGPEPVTRQQLDSTMAAVLSKLKLNELNPRWRWGAPMDTRLPGLGFRCVRSASPRYLDK